MDYALGVCHTRVPLPSAFKFEVGPIWPHFGVLIGEAAQTPGSIVLASLSNGHDHIDYRDARWGLVCFPNSKDLPLQAALR